jgi:signal transduction histidine kinase
VKSSAYSKRNIHTIQIAFFILPLALVYLESISFLFDYALGVFFVAILLTSSYFLKGNKLIFYTAYLSAISVGIYFFEPYPFTIHLAEISNHITRVIVLWIVTGLTLQITKEHDRIQLMNQTLSTTLLDKEHNQSQLEERQLQLENVNEELEAFAYAVSHDLRAPLRSIDGFSLALLEDYNDAIDDQGKDYLRRVRGASQRMGELIDAMLRLSRKTRKELHCEQVDLSEISHTLLNRLHNEEPDRKVNTSINDGLKVNGDKELLTSAMENLLQNAWKYTSKQPYASIEIGTIELEGKQAYYVKDNGIGFDQKDAKKLFLPFQRLHSAQEFPGIGIGLSTVKRIIQKHGGRIWAEGTQGKGAAFYFMLPKQCT